MHRWLGCLFSLTLSCGSPTNRDGGDTCFAPVVTMSPEAPLPMVGVETDITVEFPAGCEPAGDAVTAVVTDDQLSSIQSKVITADRGADLLVTVRFRPPKPGPYHVVVMRENRPGTAQYHTFAITEGQPASSDTRSVSTEDWLSFDLTEHGTLVSHSLNEGVECVRSDGQQSRLSSIQPASASSGNVIWTLHDKGLRRFEDNGHTVTMTHGPLAVDYEAGTLVYLVPGTQGLWVLRGEASFVSVDGSTLTKVDLPLSSFSGVWPSAALATAANGALLWGEEIIEVEDGTVRPTGVFRGCRLEPPPMAAAPTCRDLPGEPSGADATGIWTLTRMPAGRQLLTHNVLVGPENDAEAILPSSLRNRFSGFHQGTAPALWGDNMLFLPTRKGDALTITAWPSFGSFQRVWAKSNAVFALGGPDRVRILRR